MTHVLNGAICMGCERLRDELATLKEENFGLKATAGILLRRLDTEQLITDRQMQAHVSGNWRLLVSCNELGDAILSVSGPDEAPVVEAESDS